MPSYLDPEDRAERRPRLLFVNRSYWPDAEATGQFLTELCEDLAEQFDVTVIAGQPNQNPAGVAYRTHGVEVHRGVTVHRVWNSRFPKSFLPGRVINLLSFLVGATLAALRVQRPEIVVVQSDPPLLCFLGALLKRWRGARLVVHLQDIYPDLAVALGKVPDNGLLRGLRGAMARTYRRADRAIVLSRDMQTHVASFGVPAERVVRIPNWVDLDQVYPYPEPNPFRQRHGLEGRFVVMYSGNLGLCQPLGEVVEAAALLRDRPEIVFVLIGDGATRKTLEKAVHERGLENVRFLPYQPKAELAQSLSAADVHLVPLDPRVVSCVMPCKIYGVLAAGRPALVLAPEACELAELVRDGELGRVVPPGQPAALAEAIRWCAASPQSLAAMGVRARHQAEAEYGRAHCVAQIAAVLQELLPSPRRGGWGKAERCPSGPTTGASLRPSHPEKIAQSTVGDR